MEVSAEISLDPKVKNKESLTNIPKEKNDCESVKLEETKDEIANLELESKPDFSRLPIVAWVIILFYLPRFDHCRVAQTCQSLRDICSQPRFWRKMNINIAGLSSNKEAFDQRQKVLKTYITWITNFGGLFKQLEMSFSDVLNYHPGVLNDIVRELIQQCRLESLYLEVRKTNRTHTDRQYFPALVNLVKNVCCLKSFHLISWPLCPGTFENPEEDIFLALKENQKLNSLERLSLFWSERDSTTGLNWAERTLILISPAKTLDIISHFKNLSTLSLRSPMIDEGVLQEFCTKRDAELKLLCIFANYDRHVQGFSIPNISVQTWETIRKVNPELSVEITIMSLVPNAELANLIKLGCPLTRLKLSKYSRCDQVLISQLCDNCHETLRVFECHTDFADADEVLIRLVAASTHIDELVFVSALYYRTVMNIVSLRNRKWKKLRFEQISYDDDDQIVRMRNKRQVTGQGSNGAYIIFGLEGSVYRFVGERTWPYRHEIDDNERVRRYRELFDLVSHELRITWTKASYIKQWCIAPMYFIFGDRSWF